MFGHLRDLVRKRIYTERSKVCKQQQCKVLGHAASARYVGQDPLAAAVLHCLLIFCPLQGYAPIRQDYEDFYTRRMYYRIHVSVMT